MRYRKLSSDDDFTFGSGELNYLRDVPEAPGQAAETRLLLWLGEWYQNIEDGTPYMQGILGKHSQATADIIIQDRILGTEGVVNIQEYSSTLDVDTRFLSVSAIINTIYGVTSVDVLNYANY